MKILKSTTALLLATLLVMTACEDFPTKSFDFGFYEDFDINAAGTGFSAAELVDISEKDANFDKYRKKINSLDIKKVTYSLSAFSGSATQTLQNGLLEIADPNGNGKVTLASLTNVNLSSLLNNETEITVPLETLRRAEALVRQDPNRIMVYLSGTVNEGPVQVTLRLKFYTTVEARLIGSND